MILHIIPDQKFTLDYIHRIEKLFDINEHFFWIYPLMKQREKYNDFLIQDNFIYSQINESTSNMLYRVTRNADHIILHSIIAGVKHLGILQRTLNGCNAKVIWILWGADLYDDYKKSHSIRIVFKPSLTVKEHIRKKIIDRIDYVDSPCDYEELKKRYKTKAGLVCANYSFKLIDGIGTKRNTKANVMVGHSATTSCKHLSTFFALKKHKKNINVFCPLSYPQNKLYIRIVNIFGRSIFGQNYHPITTYMDYATYVQFLCRIDIGIFNNSRQQGMGNITNLLFLGKKVYMSKKNTINKIYNRKDFVYYDSETMTSADFLLPLSDTEKENNREKVLNIMSDNTFYTEWNKIFSI